MLVMLAGMQGSNKFTPPLSVLGQLPNWPPGAMEGFKLSFYSLMPDPLRLPLFQLPLWCPVKGCVGDVAWLFSHHMSDPSPSPSHDDGAHAVCLSVAAGKKVLVGDGLRPEYSQDSSKVLEVHQPQNTSLA